MNKVLIILVVFVFCFLIYAGMPLSESKAMEKAEQICLKHEAYCSGYTINKPDGTYIVVFRKKLSDFKVDTIEVSNEDIAKKIYHTLGGK